MTISNAMNSKRFDTYKKAGLCLVAASLFLSPCNEAVATDRISDAAGTANPRITVQNERLSIKAHSVPLQQLLDSMAKTCELRIMATSIIKPGTIVDVDRTDWKVEEALAELLKGNSYLVIYNEAKEKAGLFASAETFTASPPPDSPKAPAGETMQAQQADDLRSQMEMLSQRIASGASDRAYENAIKGRIASYVKHDRDLLASYEKQLARLESAKR